MQFSLLVVNLVAHPVGVVTTITAWGLPSRFVRFGFWARSCPIPPTFLTASSCRSLLSSTSLIQQSSPACKLRIGKKQGGGLKSGINEVSSTVSKQLWRQGGDSGICSTDYAAGISATIG